MGLKFVKHLTHLNRDFLVELNSLIMEQRPKQRLKYQLEVEATVGLVMDDLTMIPDHGNTSNEALDQ